MKHRTLAGLVRGLPAAVVATAAILFMVASAQASEGEELASRVRFFPGAVNRVVLESEDARLAIYAAPSEMAPDVELVLIAQGRRDTAFSVASLDSSKTRIVAPAREKYWLEQPDAFWEAFVTRRFHDYGQQSTKVLAKPLKVDRWVGEGDEVTWRGHKIRVLETPGYTRGAATYVLQVDGRKIAFTGDLIYGDGQLLDLYSFQDAIPAAQIRGYHGYGSRLAELVTSLRKVAAEQPDVIVPSRGPVIRRPKEAIERLIGRVQNVYRSYLSTSALHWYFKEDRMRTCGARVLGADAEIELMPFSHHEQTPNWIYENSTSRLLISDNGKGFLLDCGTPRVIAGIKELMEKGLVKQVEGIFVTHFHDDHTDAVQEAAETFDCPVYATTLYADVLENPSAYHLPAMTANPVQHVTPMTSGQSMKWEEFELTFFDYQGQTYYHGALLVEKPETKPVFFIGDSFSPSGIDDYCVQNRNLLHEDQGYLSCIRQVRELGDVWLVNEHIPFVFEFSTDELDDLESRYRARIAALSELFPWDDPNYGVDEQWAVFYPYTAGAEDGDELEFEVRLTNHSPRRRNFKIVPHVDTGIELLDFDDSVTLEARQTGVARVRVRAGNIATTSLITADVITDGMEFRSWIEALVTSKP